jgi:hypothetical protein
VCSLMRMRCAVLMACAALVLMAGACASLPSPPPGTIADEDSAGTVWGDEYEGLRLDPPEPGRSTRRGVRAEWIDGATQSARFDAFGYGASVRARSYPSGDAGSIAWQGGGPVREVAIGSISPVIADGALVGDPRTGGDLRAPTTTRSGGLSLATSSASWAAMTGAGVLVGARDWRAAAAAWQPRDDGSDRVAFASVEHHARGTTIGAAAGATERGASSHEAASLYVARDDGASFASGEVAMARERVRAVARVVQGERREWSAIAIAGAGPLGEEQLVFTPRERWGAALERRDLWPWGTSRGGISSLTRRAAGMNVRRRRVFWDGSWHVSDDTRFEMAARVTRESSDRGATGMLAALPAHDVRDDWRARATLRAERVDDNGRIIDNAYRLEWVQNGSGRPGTIATWTCRWRSGAMDGRLSASAYALHRGQVAYSAESASIGVAEYAAISGRGAALSASWRVSIARHAWVRAEWSKRSPDASRIWISAGFHI